MIVQQLARRVDSSSSSSIPIALTPHFHRRNTRRSGSDPHRRILATTLTASNPNLSRLPPGLRSTTELETDLPLPVAEDRVVGLEKWDASAPGGARYNLLFSAQEGREAVENAVEDECAEVGMSGRGARCLVTKNDAVPGER